jgi:hypothetical protein
MAPFPSSMSTLIRALVLCQDLPQSSVMFSSSPQSSLMSSSCLVLGMSSSARKRRIRLEAEASQAAVLAMARRTRKWGGSVPMHRVILRDREAAWAELHKRYFAEHPMFDDATFRRR